jgi:hypothetical protein
MPRYLFNVRKQHVHEQMIIERVRHSGSYWRTLAGTVAGPRGWRL